MSETVREALPALPDIDEVVPLSEADQACFRDIRAVLDKHGALSRFGVWLLHEHFEVGHDEVVVESVDKEARTLVSQPTKLSKLAQSIETSWRLDSPSGMQRCESMCARPYGPNGPHVRQHFTTG